MLKPAYENLRMHPYAEASASCPAHLVNGLLQLRVLSTSALGEVALIAGGKVKRLLKAL